MIIINFAHPISPENLQRIESFCSHKIDRIVDIRTQIDPQQPIQPQTAALIESIGLTPEDWQTLPLLVNPPPLNFIAVILLAELHGRCGYFPAHLRLRPVKDSLPPQYEVAEILNLQAIRDQARTKRC